MMSYYNSPAASITRFHPNGPRDTVKVPVRLKSELLDITLYGSVRSL